MTVQTPQAFVASVLRSAIAAGGEATDCASLVEANGGRVRDGRGRRAAAQGDDARRPRTGRGVAVAAVVFDVGETLVDETRMWEQAADAVRRPALHADGRARRARRARARTTTTCGRSLGVEPPAAGWRLDADDWYPDALPASSALRERGLPSSAPSATRRASSRSELRAARRLRRLVGALGRREARRRRSSRASSQRPARSLGRSRTWATASTTTSGRRSPPGMVAVHIRRGPWGLSARAAGRRRSGSIRSTSCRRCSDDASASGSASTRTRSSDGVPLVLGGVTVRPSPRARGALGRRRARARARRRGARRGRARRHRRRSSRRATSATAARRSSTCCARPTAQVLARRAGRSSTPTAC